MEKAWMNRSGTSPYRVVIMHPCPLARSGLRRFLELLLPWASFTCVSSFAAIRSNPLSMEAELFISEIYDREESPAHGTAWLSWLQLMRADRLMLIVTEYYEAPGLAMLAKGKGISLVSLWDSYETIMSLVGQALQGAVTMSDALALRLVQTQTARPSGPSLSLTRAEQRVLSLLLSGHSVSQIAECLNRSVKTVSTHKRQLMKKLGANTEVELFAHGASGE